MGFATIVPGWVIVTVDAFKRAYKYIIMLCLSIVESRRTCDIVSVKKLRIQWLSFFQAGCKDVKLHVFGCSTDVAFEI